MDNASLRMRVAATLDGEVARVTNPSAPTAATITDIAKHPIIANVIRVGQESTVPHPYVTAIAMTEVDANDPTNASVIIRVGRDMIVPLPYVTQIATIADDAFLPGIASVFPVGEANFAIGESAKTIATAEADVRWTEFACVMMMGRFGSPTFFESAYLHVA